jgi:hypothetical protein
MFKPKKDESDKRYMIELFKSRMAPERRKRLVDRTHEKFPEYSKDQLFVLYMSLWDGISRTVKPEEKFFPRVPIPSFGRFESQEYRRKWRKLKDIEYNAKKQQNANETDTDQRKG